MLTQVNFEALLREGCKCRVVSIRRLADLQSEIELRLEKRQFDDRFARDYMYRFKYAPPEELETARSIIIVAMPRPPTKAVFNWKGTKPSFLLPPTYAVNDQKRLHVEKLVAEAVGQCGYRIAPANLPLKLLAVRSGLAKYGKNNLAYVKDMGSFMRLTAVYSDMPVYSDDWYEHRMMDSCSDCYLCETACPTGANSGDRLLLHAEKCLTYHNEKPGDIPFPSWIKPQWHNSIIGCIKCQAACPQNKPYLDIEEASAEFSEEETELMLKGTPTDKMPAETVEKMQRLSLTEYYNELPRNLSVLLNRDTK
ncbi:MAG: 4Fe-4S double cluster binding domain-containing protein [Candidatus Bathyarchaeia archaeon]|jgi:epoxyqueuosine reductase